VCLQVTVRPYLFLQQTFGFKEKVLELPDGADLRTLMDIMHREYGLPEFHLTPNGKYQFLGSAGQPEDLMVLVDGRNMEQLQGTDTKLHEDAEISLFPPVAGG